MATGNSQFPLISPVSGFRLGATSAGIKTPGRKDLVLMEIGKGSSVAALFTQNAFCAAPVIVARDHLNSGMPSYLLVNAGNANAGTGDQGIADALQCCEQLALSVSAEAQQVLPFSTGVIGEPLPVDRIISALPGLVSQLTERGWSEAAEGILTTDTRPKGASLRFELGGKEIVVSGICKGSGMIKPNMATMLAYVATDAAVEQELLHRALKLANEKSFNRITVDGDTSTNDAVVLVATGASEVEINENNFELFVAHLTDLFTRLAQSIVRDGEGANKFVAVVIEGASDQYEALAVAYTIAESPLVKTALTASDANWGRILAAIGRSGIVDVDINKVQISLNSVLVVDKGGRAPSYTEAAGQQAMQSEDIEILVQLNRGRATETVWTTDLSYEYVQINAEYRT
jgi:glutamate N-acetyltransferase/amino-acid N-acetyltransferase